MNCAQCGRVLMDTDSDGVTRIRTRLVLIKDGKMQALCPQCKKVHILPVEVSIADAESTSRTPIKHVILNSKE